MSKPLRWGIISCGTISHDFSHAMRHCKNPNRITAVATANSLERAQEFVQKLGLGSDTKAFGSYEELLNWPEVDIVYIGVQNQGHCEWVRKAAEKKKHILCEKPLGATAAEVQAMAKCAKENGVFLMEACWSRFFPVYRTLKEGLDSKEFGELKVITAHFGNSCLAENRFRPDMGATPLNDIGIYALQFALFCVGDEAPTAIHAVGAKDPKTGCDTSANITLEFNGGAQKAYLVYSSEANMPNSGSACCEKGIYELPRFFWSPTRLIKITEPQQAGSAQQEETIDFPLTDNKDDYNIPNDTGLFYEADYVYQYIQEGREESPIHPLQTSLRLQEILHEIRRQLGVKYAQDDKPCC